MRDRIVDAVAPLRSRRGYRAYFTGRMISVLGSTVAPLALAAALADGSGAGTRIAVVLAAEYVLYLAAMPVTGLVVDRARDLRVVLVLSQVAAACCQIGEACLVLSGVRAAAPLAVAAAAGAVAASLSMVSGARLVPQLLTSGMIQQANAMLRSVMMSFAVLGPASAGTLIALVDPGWLLAWDAVTFLAAAAAVGHPLSTPSCTSTATSSSAASPTSSGSARSPPGSTSSPAATDRACCWPASSCGSATTNCQTGPVALLALRVPG